MEKLYDWDINRIKFEDKYGNKFNLQLRGQITVINGDSATGKTLICNKISGIQKDKNISAKKYDADNILILNEDNKSNLTGQKHKLIIIDRAESVLSDKEVNIINSDTDNRYLIFLRKPIGIEVTPNHFAELVLNNKEITTRYEFNVKGWC